jgi:hypothetical protein
MVTDVVDLKSWQFEMSFAKYMSEIAVVDVIEGDFLMIGGETYMAKNVDPFHGEVKVGATILGVGVSGVSGSGWLATIIFTVLEAGECPLALHDTILLDSTGTPMEHTAIGGYYLGPTADLGLVPNIYPRPKGGGHAQKEWMSTRRSQVGTGREFLAEVVNTGYAPLDVRAKFTSVNALTGTTVVFYSGQQFMSEITYQTIELYVNEHVELPGDWINTGTSPYLDAAGDGSYITGTDYCQLSDIFGFQDVTLGPMDSITEVRLEGYTRSAALDIDFDMYVWDSFAWLGSLWGNAAWEWHNPRWTNDAVSTVDPSTRTEAGLNAFSVLAHYYTPDGSPMGDADLDCLRLRVTIRTGGQIPVEPPVYQGLEPGETITLQAAIWYLLPAEVGKWYTTVEIQYLYNYDPRFPLVWLSGRTTFTYEWWCYL